MQELTATREGRPSANHGPPIICDHSNRPGGPHQRPPRCVVLDRLNAVGTCESTMWMPFYGAGNDTRGRPVYDRLQALHDAGCDVRVLLYAENSGARSALEARRVPVQFPTYRGGTALLGHKLVMVRSGGDLHLIQSSANLNNSRDNANHNLTLYLRAPGLNAIQTELEAELNRYWR